MSKIEQYLDAMREEVIAAAEAKMGRPLTPIEIEGVKNIKGGMILEACLQSFSHTTTSLEEVARELAFFARERKIGD